MKGLPRISALGLLCATLAAAPGSLSAYVIITGASCNSPNYVKWSGASMNWTINTADFANGSAADTALKSGIAEWNGQAGTNWNATTSNGACTRKATDDVNCVSWDVDNIMGASALATAYYLYFIPSCNMKEADVLFDTDRTWEYGTDLASQSAPPFNLKITAMHEFGHGMGFAHTPDQVSIMGLYSNPGAAGAFGFDPNLTIDLHADNLAALRFLYPAAGSMTDLAVIPWEYWFTQADYSVIKRTDQGVASPDFSPTGTVDRGDGGVLLDYTIENRGTTNQTFNVGFYILLNSVWTLIGTNTGVTRNAGITQTDTRVLSIPLTVPPGSYYFKVKVDDANSIAESNESNNEMKTPTPISINVNSAPTATVFKAGVPGTSFNAAWNSPLVLDVSGTDSHGDPITYSASGLPSGASFSPAARQMTWTPTQGQVGGPYNVTFTVSDGSLSSNKVVGITVVNVGPPAAASPTPGAGSVTAAWTAGGNPAGTQYFVQRAANSSFSTGLADSGWGTFTNFAFGGLSVNTTYYFRAKARDSGALAESGYTVLPAAATLANSPGASALSGATPSSLTANWTAGGNPAGTQYYAERALDSGFSSGLAGSGWTTASSYAFGGLSPNTTYYVRVKARNHGGLETSPTSLGQKQTLAAVPVAAAATDVFESSMTANWTAGGNPAGTQYYAERALDSGFSSGLAGSGWTTALSHAFAGLALNTTYYVRVKARNGEGTETAQVPLPTTVSLGAEPAAASLPQTATDYVTVSWTANGNPAGTRYEVRLSTDGHATTNAAAFTTSLSAAFGAGGTGPPLTPNSTYYARVRSLNHTQTPSAFASAGSTITLAAAPGALAAADVQSASVTAAWSAAGNPSGTPYLAEKAANAAFTLDYASSAWTTATSSLFAGLSPGVTYYFRVRAANGTGLQSAVTPLPAQETLAAAPGALPPSGVTDSAVTLFWNAGGNSAATQYKAEKAEDAAFSTGLADSGWLQSLSFSFIGLTLNTTYYFRVRARNANKIETPPTQLPTTMTLAAPPAALAAGPVYATSMTVNWGANGNPGGVEYAAEISTVAAFNSAVSTSPWVAAASYTFDSLTPNTTYYLRVRSRNSAGAESLPTALPAVETRAAEPAALSPVVLSTEAIAAYWGASGNPPATLYFAQRAGDAGFSSDLADSGWVAASSAVFSGLAVNATYYFRVKARSSGLSETAYVLLPATATFARPPAAAAFSAASDVSITAGWSADGNPAGTQYLAERADDPDFSSGLSGSGWTTALSHAFGALTPNTTYYFRVRARNRFSVATQPTSLGAAVTLATAPVSAAASAVASASVTANWSANGNPAGTQYFVERAVDAAFTIGLVQSGWISALSRTFDGLTSNATYFFRVRARNAAGIATAFTPLPAALTLAAQPGSLPPQGITESGITAAWAAAGNKPGTEFFVERDTDPAYSGPSPSGWVTETSFAFGGLPPNTTQYFRVKARNSAFAETSPASLPAVATLARAPVPAQPVPAENGLTAAWLANGNPAGTLYLAEISGDSFASVLASSATRADSVLFGAGGEGSALTPNTLYAYRIQAVSHGGQPTAYTQTASTRTLAQPPPAPALTQVHVSSATLAWGSGGNPAGTEFSAEISDDPSFASVTEATPWTNATSALFGALLADTSYYARVRARNADGAATAPSPPAVAATLASPPSALPASGISPTAIRANWGTNGNPADTLYFAQKSQDAGFLSDLSDSGWIAAASHRFTGLAPDTSYYLRVKARNRLGTETPYVALPQTLTLLTNPPPDSPQVAAMHPSSAAVSWLSVVAQDGYLLEASTSSDFTGTLFSSATPNDLVESLAVSGLDNNTTYHLRVAAVNSGVKTYAAALAAATLADAVASFQITAVFVSSASASWTPLPLSPQADAAEGYRLEACADAAFSGTIFSSQTANPSLGALTVTGLVPDTTYYLRAASINHDGRPHFAVAATTDAARAAAPLPAAAGPVAADSVRANWDTGGNPPTTRYLADVSSDAFATVNASSWTRNPWALFGSGGAGGALSAASTYYLRVRAENRNGWPTQSADLGLLHTLAFPPASQTASAVHQASITFSWAANGNPAGTVFRAAISTDAFATENARVATSALSVLFGAGGAGEPLLPNTTYYLRVAALNPAGLEAGPASLSGVASKVVEPGSASPVQTTADSIAPAWTSGGNPVPTVYEVQSSTDGFVTINASSRTIGLTASFSALEANTSYYFRVRAIGHNGAGSAFTSLPVAATQMLPPGVPGAPFSNVADVSLLLQWTSNGNGPQTVYEAALSSDSFATVYASSVTAQLSLLFGTGGAGPPLIPNTSYYAQVRAVGIAGPGSFVSFGSTVTAARAPAQSSVESVASSEVLLDWEANGNPEPGTTYQVWRATDAGFSSPVAALASTSGFLASGLSDTTTYYFKVRALGLAGAYSAFDAPVSTRTLPLPPGQPASLSGTVLGVSSIAWTWSAVPSASGYRLRLTSDTATVLAVTSATAVTSTGLFPNTSYGVEVSAFGEGGYGPPSPPASATTLAFAPAATAVSAVYGSSVTLSWSANGNPAATTAQIERSSDGSAFTPVASGPSTSYTDHHLLGCTTYYFRVRNINAAAVPTAFDSIVATRTLPSTPAPPGSLTAQSLPGRKILLEWTPSPDPQIAGYRLYGDGGSGSVDYATPAALFTSTVSRHTTGVLLSSAAYSFALRAYGTCGVEEDNLDVTAAAAARDVPPEAQAAVRAPQGGTNVSGNRLTVAAELLIGTMQGTRKVLFQYKPSTASVWHDIPAASGEHPNPDTVFPYYVHLNADALPETRYDLRAVAFDADDVPDPSPPSVTVTRSPVPDADLSESVSGLSAVALRSIHNTLTNTVLAADIAQAQLAKVTVPPDALDETTATLRIANNPSSLPQANPGLESVGVGVEISLGNQQHLLRNGKQAAVTLTYPDDNDDGLVDGLLIPADRLAMYSYDEGAAAWVKDIVSTVNAASHTVTGLTPHFSFFALFALPAHAATSEVRVYPIPFVPSNGNPDDGTAFDAANPNSGILFDQLPPNAEVTIYSVTGQKVVALRSGQSGRIQWDVKNASGRDAASGGYVAVIRGPGQEPVMRKILIIR